MQENTKQEQNAQLSMQLGGQNDNNNNYSKQLLESEPIENTGFKVTGNKETGYYLTFGQYVLTEHPTTKEEVIQKVKDKDWTIIQTLCATLTEHILKAEVKKSALEMNEYIQQQQQLHTLEGEGKE